MLGIASFGAVFLPALLVGAMAFLLVVVFGVWVLQRSRTSPAATSSDVLARSLFENNALPAEGHEGLRSEAHDPFIHGSVSEKRASPRRGGSIVVVEVSHLAGGESPWRAYLVDRSAGGLGLEMKQPVPVNTLLEVRKVSSNRSCRSVSVRVRHCTPHSGCWQVGCQFVKPPHSGDLWQFG